MGTRFGRVVLLLAVIGLALTSLAWAEKPAEDPAPAPAVVAQAPAVQAAAADENTPAVAPAAQSEAVETQGVTKNAKGTVYYYDDRRWEVWATIGANQGLRPTAQVAFVRDGAVIATGTVKTVRSADAIIEPDKDTPAGTILKGDDVRVVVNGSRAALDKVIEGERRTEFLGAVFFYVLITGSIIAAR